jgi:RNA polymerase sigma-70 factor (ECF subfamily)
MKEDSTSVNDLARACSRSVDAAEWDEFVRRCAPLASLVALRVSRIWVREPSLAAVDDIVQDVFLKLCEQERRILRDFVPRGEDSFFGLLRIVAASVANDYYRRLYSAKRGGNVVTTVLVGDETSLESAGMHPSAQMHQDALFGQLDKKLKSASKTIGERDRAIFWLYYRQGFTAEEIARLPASGLTAKGVESALRRMTGWLRDELERKEPANLREAG